MKFKIFSFIITSKLLFLLTLQSSFALTEGSYFTVGLSNSDLSYSSSSNGRVNLITGSTSFRLASDGSSNNQDSANPSLNLSIAKSLRANKFNIINALVNKVSLPSVRKLTDSTFINYKIFYDHMNADFSTDYNLSLNTTALYNATVSINSRYGAMIGLGYDLPYGLSTYFNYGISTADYNVKSDFVLGSVNYSDEENNRDTSSIFALGFNYELINNILLGLEYSRQEIELKSDTFLMDAAVGGKTSTVFNTKIDTYSLTASYRF